MPPLPDPNGVFLNIPYDVEFSGLYIAYIVGLFQLDLVPHIASEIPGGKRRLDRIFELIQSCRYSIHDLSRVEVSVSPTAVPRFNMPLELGMTITWANLHPKSHIWSVWESEPYRLQRSANDLNGTDPYIPFIIPAAPGGAYDISARLLIPALQKASSANSATHFDVTAPPPYRKC